VLVKKRTEKNIPRPKRVIWAHVQSESLIKNCWWQRRCWCWCSVVVVVVVVPASGIGPSSYGLGAPAIHPMSSCSSAWGGCSVIHRPCHPIVVCCPIVPVLVLFSLSSSLSPLLSLLLAWCSPMSLLASNTYDPPCEQLLAGVGAGAGSSIVVVFCGRFSLVALVLWSWLSPSLLSPLPFVVIAIPPAIHPPSSCLWGWGRVVCLSSPWVVVVGPGAHFHRHHLFWGGLGGSA
jgi:hypothetical protein